MTQVSTKVQAPDPRNNASSPENARAVNRGAYQTSRTRTTTRTSTMASAMAQITKSSSTRTSTRTIIGGRDYPFGISPNGAVYVFLGPQARPF
jgi:hypothetical protein